MVLGAFKEGVKKLRTHIEEFKSDHKMASEAISEFIESDFCPWPFKPFCKIVWNGLEKDDQSGQKMLNLLEKISNSNEQSFEKLESMLSDFMNTSVKSEDLEEIGKIIRTSNESLSEALDHIHESIERLTKTSQTDDIKLVLDRKDLETYYDVIRNNIVNIRDSKVEELFDYVKNWDWQNRIGKPILLITGDPGLGKSWLAYRLVNELMSDGYDIIRITGPNIQRTFFLKETQVKDLKNLRKSVFILDDQGISFAEVNTRINQEDVYELIKNMTDMGQRFLGPLIISMREQTWENIVHGTKERNRISEPTLKKLVEKSEVLPLRTEDSVKVVESFYANPEYPNIPVNLKKKIAEKSMGNPMIVRLFLDQMLTDHGTHYAITVEDIEHIIGSAKYYSLRQILDYYLSNISDDQVSSTIAFLYYIVKKGFISIGYLKFLIKRIGENAIPEEIKEYISRQGAAFPLFKIDEYGLVMPNHDIIREVIIDLVEDIDNLESHIPKNKKDLLTGEIRRIRDIDFFSNITIKERTQNDFFNRYKDYIERTFKFYVDRLYKKEVESPKMVTSESAFDFFSLVIEFFRVPALETYEERTFGIYLGKGIWRKVGRSPPWNEEQQRADIVKSVLESITIEYGDLGAKILKQLHVIFQRLGFFFPKVMGSISHVSAMKKYYLKIFEIDIGRDGPFVYPQVWSCVKYLILKRIVTSAEMFQLKSVLFELLESSDQYIGEEVRLQMRTLIDMGEIDVDDYDKLLRFLRSENMDLVYRAVTLLNEIIERKANSQSIILRKNLLNSFNKSELRSLLFILLRSSDQEISYQSFNIFLELIKDDIMSLEETKLVKDTLFYMLALSFSDAVFVRSNVHAEIIQNERFWEIYESRRFWRSGQIETYENRRKTPGNISQKQVLIKTWKAVMKLIDMGLVTPKEALYLKEKFIDLVKSPDKQKSYVSNLPGMIPYAESVAREDSWDIWNLLLLLVDRYNILDIGEVEDLKHSSWIDMYPQFSSTSQLVPQRVGIQ